MKAIHFMHVAVLSSALWLAGEAAAQEFSADVVVHDSTGRILKSKMYMGHGKVRVEDREDSAGMNPNDSSIVILDLARRVGYVLIPAKKTYTEQTSARLRQSFAEFQVSGDPCALDPPGAAVPKCAKLGSEVVNGRTTDKWEITANLRGQAIKSHVWIDTHFHVPIKSEIAGTGSELQNLQEGSQPAGLFETPADYHKMDTRDMLRSSPAK